MAHRLQQALQVFQEADHNLEGSWCGLSAHLARLMDVTWSLQQRQSAVNITHHGAAQQLRHCKTLSTPCSRAFSRRDVLGQQD